MSINEIIVKPGNSYVSPEMRAIAWCVDNKSFLLNEQTVCFVSFANCNDASNPRNLLGNNFSERALNAPVLNWFLNHQESIPDGWKELGMIVFAGTIFYNVRKLHFIPCLKYDKAHGWKVHYAHANPSFLRENQFLCLASSCYWASEEDLKIPSWEVISPEYG